MEHFTVEAIADPALYGDEGRLQRFFAWLRREQPIAWAEPPGHRPFWVLSRHADIREAERRPDAFNAGPRNTLFPIEVEEANRRFFGVETSIRTLVVLDGQRHQDLRLMTQDYFLPRNVRRLEAMIDALAAEFVDRMLAMGDRCDVAADIAFWFPLRVAMTILGIDADDEAVMLKLTHEIFGSSDPAIRRPGMTQAEHLIAVKKDYETFFDAVTQDRRARPRDDVATLIATGVPADGRALTDEERLGYYVIIATAGHDTTAASIAGGLKALIDYPDQMAMLRADRRLLKSFANEAVRWTAPVKHFFRNMAEDYTMDGRTFRAGQHVMLNFAAACRDPALFADADRFRVDRPSNNHLAFGYGPHSCLGQFLAKLEIEAFFRALLDRTDVIEMDGLPRWTEASFVSGLTSLPIRFSARRAA